MGSIKGLATDSYTSHFDMTVDLSNGNGADNTSIFYSEGFMERGPQLRRQPLPRPTDTFTCAISNALEMMKIRTVE